MVPFHDSGSTQSLFACRLGAGFKGGSWDTKRRSFPHLFRSGSSGLLFISPHQDIHTHRSLLGSLGLVGTQYQPRPTRVFHLPTNAADAGNYLPSLETHQQAERGWVSCATSRCMGSGEAPQSHRGARLNLAASKVARWFPCIGMSSRRHIPGRIGWQAGKVGERSKLQHTDSETPQRRLSCTLPRPSHLDGACRSGSLNTGTQKVTANAVPRLALYKMQEGHLERGGGSWHPRQDSRLPAWEGHSKCVIVKTCNVNDPCFMLNSVTHGIPSFLAAICAASKYQYDLHL